MKTMEHNENQSRGGVLSALARLVAPILKVHAGVMLWRPPYAQMKDSVYTTLAHLIVLGVVMMAILLVYSQQLPQSAEALLPMAEALGFLLAPPFAFTVLARFTPNRSHYLAAMLAGFAVTDAATLVVMAYGVSLQETYWIALGVKAFFCATNHIAFMRCPEEVRRRGYGLKTGEI